MAKDTVRVNITLPEDVLKSLDSITEPRERSRFITTAVMEKIERRQKEELSLLLKEGYLEGRQEALELSREFEAADLEGLDEY
jgi:metal-responsive CopG/Arc/MetJ family transcriptional regulator